MPRRDRPKACRRPRSKGPCLRRETRRPSRGSASERSSALQAIRRTQGEVLRPARLAFLRIGPVGVVGIQTLGNRIPNLPHLARPTLLEGREAFRRFDGSNSQGEEFLCVFPGGPPHDVPPPVPV